MNFGIASILIIFLFLNESFELILIDKSVGPQESGQPAAMQCVMSAGGGGRRREPGAGGLARLLPRVVDEYQFKRFVLCRVGIPIVSYPLVT